MKIDPKLGARMLTAIEVTIAVSYFYLALDHVPYFVIGIAHLVAAVLHSTAHEL